MSFIEEFKDKPETQENTGDRESIQLQIQALQKRLDDLNIWQNNWIPEDRMLADNLQTQIDALKLKLAK